MSAFIRLARLHQPVGIWLLLWPCLWSLALASGGMPPVPLIALFAVGAVCMRSAGCIVNDIADRDFDRAVARTKTRPLAAGEISVRQALALCAALLAIALSVAILLGAQVVLLACLALPLVFAYPFMKRITWWPQLFLGITFNWGALMGWAAVQDALAITPVLLYAGGIFWTLGYDTIYAHQDKEDDMLIGVRSTAIRLSVHPKRWIGGFYAMAILSWAAAGYAYGTEAGYYLALLLVAAHLFWQVMHVQLDDAASCLRIFRSNSLCGAALAAGCMLAG